MCPLDMEKYSALKEEPKESNNSSMFRNIAFCAPDSHAEEKGVPLGNLFLNEGDSGDLESSTVTDLGSSIDYIYVLDHFQYMDFKEGDENGNVVFSTIQYKSPFAPCIIRDTVNKEIFALPFWGKEGVSSVLNSDKFAGTKRSNRFNIYVLIKIDGEWKRAKIKASASTIYGADFNKETKKPDPKFKEPMADSLLGFIQAANKEAGQDGYYKVVKCKLSTAAVGSKNKRLTFMSAGLSNPTEADIVLKEFIEFKEGVANENASKLSHFAKEQISWEEVENVEYIAAYLKNPLLATYNETKGISKMLLPTSNAVVMLKEAGKSLTTSTTSVEGIAESFETGEVEDSIKEAEVIFAGAPEKTSKLKATSVKDIQGTDGTKIEDVPF